MFLHTNFQNGLHALGETVDIWQFLFLTDGASKAEQVSNTQSVDQPVQISEAVTDALDSSRAAIRSQVLVSCEDMTVAEEKVDTAEQEVPDTQNLAGKQDVAMVSNLSESQDLSCSQDIAEKQDKTNQHVQSQDLGAVENTASNYLSEAAVDSKVVEEQEVGEKELPPQVDATFDVIEQLYDPADSTVATNATKITAHQHTTGNALSMVTKSNSSFRLLKVFSAIMKTDCICMHAY